MSRPDTWCDNIIMQAVANALCCIMHITDSNIASAEATVITPVCSQGKPKLVFLGYINGLHYVSTVQKKCGKNKNRLRNLKSKLTMNNEKKQKKLTYYLAYEKRKAAQETKEEKQTRQKKLREYAKKKRSQESKQKQKRRQKLRENVIRKRSKETKQEKQRRLQRAREYKKRRKLKEIDAGKLLTNQRKGCVRNAVNTLGTSPHGVQQRQVYLNEFDTVKNGPLHQQNWAKTNIANFHRSMKYSIYQCTIWKEAWPRKSKPRSPDSYICLQCSRDKNSPKKFSVDNLMIPSTIPIELQGLTQIEEMLIARALPIMRVYIKPGGQRGYSGHCINLPQNIKDLALTLPRYPKDLSVIIVKVRGRNNTFKDVNVRRQKVHKALLWLLQNNPQHADISINLDALNCLPVNGIPTDLVTVECNDEIVSDEVIEAEGEEPTENADEDIVYNQSAEMSSFLPVAEQQQKEIQAIRNQICGNEPINWPSVDNQPLNEYQTPFLATMAFLTLFPDGKGDPTNPSILRDIPLNEKIKHLIKFAEKVNGKWLYRFASHPRFSYWAFDMIHRKRALQQSGIFLKQNPGEAHLIMDELREMATRNNSAELISKISRYVANIAGTNVYWRKVRDNLKAIITTVGSPTCFSPFHQLICTGQSYMLFSNKVQTTSPVKNGGKMSLTTLILLTGFSLKG